MCYHPQALMSFLMMGTVPSPLHRQERPLWQPAGLQLSLPAKALAASPECHSFVAPIFDNASRSTRHLNPPTAGRKRSINLTISTISQNE